MKACDQRKRNDHKNDRTFDLVSLKIGREMYIRTFDFVTTEIASIVQFIVQLIVQLIVQSIVGIDSKF